MTTGSFMARSGCKACGAQPSPTALTQPVWCDVCGSCFQCGEPNIVGRVAFHACPHESIPSGFIRQRTAAYVEGREAPRMGHCNQANGGMQCNGRPDCGCECTDCRETRTATHVEGREAPKREMGSTALRARIASVPPEHVIYPGMLASAVPGSAPYDIAMALEAAHAEGLLTRSCSIEIDGRNEDMEPAEAAAFERGEPCFHLGEEVRPDAVIRLYVRTSKDAPPSAPDPDTEACARAAYNAGHGGFPRYHWDNKGDLAVRADVKEQYRAIARAVLVAARGGK